MTVPAQSRPVKSRMLGRRPSKAPCDFTQRLPVEILSYILDDLSQPDVLCAARVSRRWRAIATAHRKYYAYICFKNSMSAPWSANWELHVARFCNQLRRCRKRGVRTSLCVTVINDSYGWLKGISPHPGGQWTHWILGTEPVRDLYLERILPAIRDSLDTVIKLVLEGDISYAEHMYAALRVPAPRLEFLELACMDNIDDVAPPPVDLFACDAPRLRDVRMFGFSLPLHPVAAFQNARHVTLCFMDQPPLPQIMSIFPHPVTLDISCGLTNELPQAPARGCCVPFGTKLRTLRLDICTETRCPLDICLAVEQCDIIETIEVDFSGPDARLAPFLQNHPGSLGLLYDKKYDGPDRTVSIQVDDGRDYLRIFHVEKGIPWDLSRELNCLHAHLVVVDLLQEYVTDFLRELHKLPVLTTFKIDVRGYNGDNEELGHGAFWASAYACYGDDDYIYLRDEPVHCADDHWDPETGWGPALDTLDPFDPDFAAECPQLRHLELYDYDREAAVDRREFVHLARSLSLFRSESDHEPSAILRLDGVELVGPPHMAMNMMFFDIDAP